MVERKSPGFKDIGDLRAKLGLTPGAPAKKDGGAGPAEDTPTMPVSPAMVVDEDDGDEATSMVSVVDEADLKAIVAMPAADVGMRDAKVGMPVDAATIPVGHSPLTGPAIPPPAADAPTAAYVSPSAEALASAPPPAGLAGPFASGGPLPAPPAEPLIAPPPGALPGSIDMGDATVVAFAPVQRGFRKALVTLVVVVGVLALGFGYLSGTANKDRHIMNIRIRDAQRLVKPLKASVASVKAVVAQLRREEPNTVNWKLAEGLATFNAGFKVEDMITDNLLMGPSITSDLLEYAFLANQLQELAQEHAKTTLKKHRQFLEDFAKGTAALQSDRPLFVFHQQGQGILVTVESPPAKDSRKQVVKVRTLAGNERDVDLTELVAMDKADLLGAAGPSVMELYSARVREMQRVVALVDKIMDGLVTRVQTEADRNTVLAL